MRSISNNCLLLFTILILCFSHLNNARLFEEVVPATNTTNISNQTNKTNQTNETTSFVTILPLDPKSKLSASKRSDLDTWIEWKNKLPRYDSHFDPVPKIFAPEKDYYKNSIIALGTPMFMVGGIVMFMGLMFCLFRYVLGRCGAKTEDSGYTMVSRFKRHCSITTMVIGLLLWFCGMVVGLTGTMAYNNALKDNTDNLIKNMQVGVDQAEYFQTIADKINNQSLVYKDEKNNIENFEMVITKYPIIISETKTILNGGESYKDYLNSDNNVFQGFIWVFFVFGFLFLIVLVFAFFKRNGNLSLILGFFYILFSAMAFGVAGFYYSQVAKVGDICEQSSQIVNLTNPESGKGIFRYIRCPETDAVKTLSEVNNVATTNLNIAIDEFNKTFNVTFPQIKLIKHTDIIDLLKNGTLGENKELIKWGQIISDLDVSLYGLENLKKCVNIREYCVNSESGLCVDGLPGLYLGFIGVLCQAIAFFLLIFVGIQFKKVLTKMKSDLESMINIRQAGGFA